MPNQRKTLKRSFSLGRLLRPRRNRRVRPKEPAKPRDPLDWGAIKGRARAAGLVAAKGLVVLAVLAAAGAGGYWGYRQVSTSTTFYVKTIEIDGARRAPNVDLLRLVKTAVGQGIFSLDLDQVCRAIRVHPWVKSAEASRELPATIRIRVTEHTPRALLLLGHLYLVNSDGAVFKRAEPGDHRSLPVITGLTRLDYINNPGAARPLLRRALTALDRYQATVRPPLGEINIGEGDSITLFLRRGGTALRFGAEVNDRKLQKLDTVWAALGPDARRLRVVHLDGTKRHDRVTVRLSTN